MARSTSTFPEKDIPFAPRTGAPLQESGGALDPATIAELSSRQISRMTRPELVRVVRAGRLPSLGARPERLDRATLERLAYLARLSCRRRPS